MPNLKTIPEGNFLVAQTSKKRYLRWFSRHSHPPDMLSQILDIIPAYPKVFWGLFCVFQKCKINLKRISFFNNYWPQFHKKCDKNVYDSYLTCLQFWFSFDLFWRQGKKRFTNYYFFAQLLTTVPYKRWQECLSFFPDLPSVLNFCETNIFVKSSSFFKIGKEKQINT